MEEEEIIIDEKTEEEKPEPDSTGEGSKPETITLVDQANIAAERLENANKQKEKLLVAEETLMAKQRLAGRAEAGGEPAKEEEISDADYANEVMSGKKNEKEN